MGLLSAIKRRSLTFKQEVPQDSFIIQSQQLPQENNNNHSNDTCSAFIQAAMVSSNEDAELQLIRDFHEAALQATMSDVERPRSIIISLSDLSPLKLNTSHNINQEFGNVNDDFQTYANTLAHPEDEGSSLLWRQASFQVTKINSPPSPTSPQDLQLVIRSNRTISVVKSFGDNDIFNAGRGLGLVWQRGSIQRLNRRRSQIQASHGTSLQLAFRPELSVMKRSSSSHASNFQVAVRPQLKIAVWQETPTGAVRQVSQPKALQLLAPPSLSPSSRTASSSCPSRLFIQPAPPSSITSTAFSAPVTPLRSKNTSIESNPLILKLGDFTVIKQLGSGAFGTVFHARHNLTGIGGALKVIPKMPGDDPFGEEKKSGYSTGLLRDHAHMTQGDKTAAISSSSIGETKALKKVAGIDGALNILASFHDTRNFYNFTILYPGGDFHSLLKRFKGPLSAKATQFYIADLLLSIKKIHDARMVHRDIKPANILVDKDGHLVLADFGLAKIFDDSSPLVKVDTWVQGQLVETMEREDLFFSTAGTPGFMPPELLLGQGASYGADIFALGVLVFIMITGRGPWDRYLRQHHFNILEVVAHRYPRIDDEELEKFNIPESLRDFVSVALDKNPKHRANVQQLMDHPFFDDFDWNKHASRLTKAPWAPSLVKLDAANDQSSTFIASHLHIRAGEQFDGTSLIDRFPEFTYISPTFSSALESASSQSSLRSSPLRINSTLINNSSSPATSLTPGFRSRLFASFSSRSRFPSRLPSPSFKMIQVPASPPTSEEDRPTPLLDISPPSVSRKSRIRLWAADVWTKLKHRRIEQVHCKQSGERLLLD
ncbi:hypothetical protein ABKN59_002657 [Abortiporus biennis]